MTNLANDKIEQTLIKHIRTTIRTNIWAWLAKHGIGDPLNQLVYIHKYQPHRRK